MAMAPHRRFIPVFLLSAILFIIILSGPYLLIPGERGIVLNLRAPIMVLESLSAKIEEGHFFDYYAGKMKWNLAATLPVYVFNSIKYILASSIISLFLGISFTLLLSDNKHRWIKEIISFFSIIPDFLFAVILQLIVVLVYQATGIHVARTASMGGDNPAVLLPLLTMVLVSILFILQSASIHYRYIKSQPYITFAESLGLSKRNIKYRHILPGLLHYLRTDIQKFIVIMFGSLFITERIFNIPGITRFIFGYAFETGKSMYYSQILGRYHGPQMNIALTAILALIAIYFIAVLVLGGLVRLAERLVQR